MKKDLLVTLADTNFINQAKQLFSSVYYNSGWQGDYMLFAYEIPQDKLKWFIDKGILIKHCEPIPYTQGLKHIKYPTVLFAKFYLFLTEFRKWKNIVFLDADIIVKGPLDKLTRVKGFTAPNATNINLKKCFLCPESELYRKLTKDYPLTGSAFTGGVIAFNTEVIKEDSFSKLVGFVRLYGSLNLGAEEPTFNLLFYKQWKKLPWIYNLYPKDFQYRYRIGPDRIKSIIIHFVESYKPWDKRSFFYKEWRDNLKKAEFINLENRPPAAKRWTEIEMQLYLLYLQLRLLYLKLRILYLKLLKKLKSAIPRQIDRLMGLIGIFLKKHYPKLYFRLKRIKNGKSKTPPLE